MPRTTTGSHVHFDLKSSDQRLSPTPNQFDDRDAPPPWEPQFEDLSLSSRHLPRRRPLDPPPACFSTPSPLRVRSKDFPPFRIPAVSDKLADGFRVLYPRQVLDRHGIHCADWVRFLEDLGIAARLSTEGLRAVGSRAPASPTCFTLRIFRPRALGAVYDTSFARSPVEEVRTLIRIWNQCAFERRKVRVTLLSQTQVRSTGMNGAKRCALLVESL